MKEFSRAMIALMLLACSAAAWPREIPKHPHINPHAVDGSALGGPVDLTQNWLLQQGDNPAYAKQRFDDRQWIIVDAGRPLAAYGLKNVDVVWYRTHVSIPPAEQNMQLLVRTFAGSFEVFVNGVKLGDSGPHPTHGAAQPNTDMHFSIPDELIATGEVTIALRAEVGRATAGGIQEGGLLNWSTIMLGPASEIASETSLSFFRQYASTVTNILVQVLVPLIALALAVTLPKEREYLCLVIAGAAATLADAYSLWRQLHNVPLSDFSLIADNALTTVAVLALLEFVRRTLGLPTRRWYVAYLWTLGFMGTVATVIINHMYSLGNGVAAIPLVLLNVLGAVVLLPVDVGIPIVLLWAWRKLRNPDALLLFVPFLFRSVVSYWTIGANIFYHLHLRDTSLLPVVPVDALFVNWSEVANLLFSVSLLIFLMLRTVRIARSRADLASDLEAVQGVQQILLSRASHDTPGFAVEHVYYPANEVGGDFFLVSPGQDGSLTAIVGDVSGKGLVAAMRVAMILGVLRREEEREPASVLSGLNEALLMQGDMGFTTACCVRIDEDGTYRVANGGHITPYIDGREVPTENSLPLGLEPGQTYEQVSGVLAEGQTMVLMSDGVVEARSRNGELYGFERLGALTRMKAEDIADVARRFGQEDDITVLTLARV